MNIDVVIVTYNRIEKLKKALSAYNRQTAPFRSLIIVNNNSTDGTKEFLKEWQEEHSTYSKYIINLSRNKGGSGGFYEGQVFALSLNPDWIYVSDDDAYPDENMFEQFQHLCRKIDISHTAAICATVKNMDDTIAYYHRGKYTLKKGVKFKRTNMSDEDYKQEYFCIELLSYVGSFIKTKAIKKVGVCNPDFFIFYDDTEHSLRLRKYGAIYCCSKMVIYHDNASFDGYCKNHVLLNWTKYYYCRNQICMLKKHHIASAIYESVRFLFEGLTSKNLPILNVIITALFDAWSNRLGIHKKYKPGFIIYKE